MGDIQKAHESDNNQLVTNQELLGNAGNRVLIAQDEKHLQDCLVADVECDYSPLSDGVESHKRSIPNTYDTNEVDGFPSQRVSEDPKEY